jgi:hypothetical protein
VNVYVITCTEYGDTYVDAVFLDRAKAFTHAASVRTRMEPELRWTSSQQKREDDGMLWHNREHTRYVEVQAMPVRDSGASP